MCDKCTCRKANPSREYMLVEMADVERLERVREALRVGQSFVWARSLPISPEVLHREVDGVLRRMIDWR